MPSNTSLLPKFTNTIHIRDFIVDVGPDKTHEGSSSWIEIHADVNIFSEEEFSDPSVIVEPIQTDIRAFLKLPYRTLYVPNAFFFAIGSFSTVVMPDNKLKITMLQTLTIERYDYVYLLLSIHQTSYRLMLFLRSPGDVSSDEYESHLPEQWCPLVTVIGFVGPKKVASASLRHFQLQTSVYEPSTSKGVEFSIFCFLASGRRWENFVMPNAGSCVSITAKVVGRVETENCLAVRMLDMSYIPTSSYAQANVVSPAQPVTPSGRANRWANRVKSATPSKTTHTSASEDDNVTRSSKRKRTSAPEDESATRSPKRKHTSVSEGDSDTHSIEQSALDFISATTDQGADVSIENHSGTLSPVVDSDHSLVDLVKVKTENGSERLLRTRRMNKNQ